MNQIQQQVNRGQLIRDIEEGFALYSSGNVTVPPVGFLHFDSPPGDVHIKYGAIADDDCYVLKLASAFHENEELNMPVNNGLMLLFNQKTGQLKRILLDEGWLTDMRTAAAGAVVAKHLAPKNVQRIGIIGTGIQARLQLEYLRDVIDCPSCIVWGRNSAKAHQMIEELQTYQHFIDWGIRLEVTENLSELLNTCQLIVTTTPATKPLIHAEQIHTGMHITALGSDDHGKQELDAQVLAQADLVVADSVEQCVDHGECYAAVNGNYIQRNTIVEIGSIITDSSLGRKNDDQITIADLTGIAVQDIKIAKMIDRELNKKLVTELDR